MQKTTFEKVFEWGDPPDKPKSNGRVGARVSTYWSEVAQTLRDCPGQWAMVIEGSTPANVSNLCNRIKKGTSKAFLPAGDFEALYRRVKEDDGTVVYRAFARFVGVLDDEATGDEYNEEDYEDDEDIEVSKVTVRR